jgi:hypothetical protein
VILRDAAFFFARFRQRVRMTRRKKPSAPRRKAGAKKDLREEINVQALIEALEAHVLEGKELTATQVNTALALLKKILPDISAAAPKAPETASSAHEDALSALE